MRNKYERKFEYIGLIQKLGVDTEGHWSEGMLLQRFNPKDYIFENSMI